MTMESDYICRLQGRISQLELENTNQSASLDAAEALVRKNADRMNEMQKEIDSWIADRDSWIARYQEQSKRIAELDDDAQRLHDRKEEFATELVKANQRIAELESELSEFRIAWAQENSTAKYDSRPRIAGLQSLNEDLMANGNSLRERAQIENLTVMRDALQARTMNQAKRIAELEGNQCYSGACSYAVNYEEDMTTYRIRIDKQRAALKKLGKAKRARGKALVAEVAARIAYENNMQLCECEEYAKCQARQQLRQEGKL